MEFQPIMGFDGEFCMISDKMVVVCIYVYIDGLDGRM